MTGRELAWRVLSNELRASTQTEKGTGERAASYVISPIGGRLNRVLLTGTLAPPDRSRMGGGFVQSQLTDPTGAVPVTAGSYQPQGQRALEGISSPTTVMLVGKAAPYQSPGAGPVTSVRVEAVRPLADAEHRTLCAESATQTLDRLDLVLRLRATPTLSDAELQTTGVSPAWIQGARASILRYPPLDPAPYYESLRAVLIALRAGPEVRSPTPPRAAVASTPVEVVRSVQTRPLTPTPSTPPAVAALGGRLLEIVDELAEESPDGYADLDELVERAARRGLDEERMEQLLNFLSDNGTLEEPLVGKFRRADGPPRE